MTQFVKAKVADPGRLERGVPVRIEMLIGRIELRLAGLGIEHHDRRGKQVLAARGILKFELAQIESTEAILLHIDVGTLRNWEQGIREPTGPAKALLTAIARDPEHVLKALAA
jgi:hypothetical protein